MDAFECLYEVEMNSNIVYILLKVSNIYSVIFIMLHSINKNYPIKIDRIK